MEVDETLISSLTGHLESEQAVHCTSEGKWREEFNYKYGTTTESLSRAYSPRSETLWPRNRGFARTSTPKTECSKSSLSKTRRHRYNAANIRQLKKQVHHDKKR